MGIARGHHHIELTNNLVWEVEVVFERKRKKTTSMTLNLTQLITHTDKSYNVTTLTFYSKPCIQIERH